MRTGDFQKRKEGADIVFSSLPVIMRTVAENSGVSGDYNTQGQTYTLSIIGEDMIEVGNTYSFLSSFNSSRGQYIWSISDIHDDETTYNLHYNRSIATLTVNRTGEYYLTLTYISPNNIAYTTDITILAYE